MLPGIVETCRCQTISHLLPPASPSSPLVLFLLYRCICLMKRQMLLRGSLLTPHQSLPSHYLHTPHHDPHPIPPSYCFLPLGGEVGREIRGGDEDLGVIRKQVVNQVRPVFCSVAGRPNLKMPVLGASSDFFVDGCSAVVCDFGIFIRRGEFTSFCFSNLS